MAEIIDVSFTCNQFASALRLAGVKTVIRYYTRDSAADSPKRLGPSEATALAAAGLRLAIVYEGRRGNQIDYFDNSTGVMDGAYARSYAHHTISQPGGTAIYFGIDTDASPTDIRNRVIP